MSKNHLLDMLPKELFNSEPSIQYLMKVSIWRIILGQRPQSKPERVGRIILSGLLSVALIVTLVRYCKPPKVQEVQKDIIGCIHNDWESHQVYFPGEIQDIINGILGENVLIVKPFYPENDSLRSLKEIGERIFWRNRDHVGEVRAKTSETTINGMDCTPEHFFTVGIVPGADFSKITLEKLEEVYKALEAYQGIEAGFKEAGFGEAYIIPSTPAKRVINEGKINLATNAHPTALFIYGLTNSTTKTVETNHGEGLAIEQLIGEPNQ